MVLYCSASAGESAGATVLLKPMLMLLLMRRILAKKHPPAQGHPIVGGCDECELLPVLMLVAVPVLVRGPKSNGTVL